MLIAIATTCEVTGFSALFAGEAGKLADQKSGRARRRANHPLRDVLRNDGRIAVAKLVDIRDVFGAAL